MRPFGAAVQTGGILATPANWREQKSSQTRRQTGLNSVCKIYISQRCFIPGKNTDVNRIVSQSDHPFFLTATKSPCRSVTHQPQRRGEARRGRHASTPMLRLPSPFLSLTTSPADLGFV
ncbi:hypothetical protein E2C01_050886 [Portunus trituberculatus]|uniref:Uncharacterized protein n=1 Tax=Portunus trituberculatus TaxID=210409 RepID=A0A5B7GHA4_PORTR|nr:hypothetical protein [Portunus trituberculatus]